MKKAVNAIRNFFADETGENLFLFVTIPWALMIIASVVICAIRGEWI